MLNSDPQAKINGMIQQAAPSGVTPGDALGNTNSGAGEFVTPGPEQLHTEIKKTIVPDAPWKAPKFDPFDGGVPNPLFAASQVAVEAALYPVRLGFSGAIHLIRKYGAEYIADKATEKAATYAPAEIKAAPDKGAAPNAPKTGTSGVTEPPKSDNPSKPIPSHRPPVTKGPPQMKMGQMRSGGVPKMPKLRR